MIFRRFALAIGLVFAFLGSQLPEFTQQYRQRIGGAVDELNRIVAEFDRQVADQHLDRAQGIRQLEANSDQLARQRGESMAGTVERRDRLARQQRALDTAGPISQYGALAEDFDSGVASQAYRDYQPAVPTNEAGIVATLVGLVLGWSATHLFAWPVRRRLKRGKALLPPAEEGARQAG